LLIADAETSTLATVQWIVVDEITRRHRGYPGR
jgi:hypothetical protein